VRQVRDLPCAGFRIVLELEVRRVACRRCGGVKRERLDFLADNPHFTKRFAYYVGRRCAQASIRDVARELKLDWDTVKTLEMQYMRAQIARAGTPGPKAIGIDEISIRKGHSYRIVVSDLIRKRPIWFGGEDRSEASMAQFYAWLGLKKSRQIRLAVMDMWKPFRNVAKDKGKRWLEAFICGLDLCGDGVLGVVQAARNSGWRAAAQFHGRSSSRRLIGHRLTRRTRTSASQV
jgi:transposase